MLRLVLLVSLAAAGAARTSETVQRVVMVRTSGSDLAPAASGYIYKKGGGRESVVEMGESEVEAHLARMYGGPERVVPVSERQDERADGLADVDYKKIFDDYSAAYGDGRAYDDYLKRFEGGLHSKSDAASAGDAGRAGSYRDAKFESYSIAGGHEQGPRDDAHDQYYDRHHRGSNEQLKGERDDARGFRGVYDDSDHKYHKEYLGEQVQAFPDEHKYYGSNGRGHKYGSHESKHHDAKIGDAGDASAEQPADHSSSAEQPRAGAPAGGRAEGSSFGYDIEH